MIKSDLVRRISAQKPHLHLRDIENLVSTILVRIAEALSRGDRVEIRGFGVFSVRKRRARTGRNPRTGALVAVDQKSMPFFKVGKEMRALVNQPGPPNATQ